MEVRAEAERPRTVLVAFLTTLARLRQLTHPRRPSSGARKEFSAAYFKRIEAFACSIDPETKGITRRVTGGIPERKPPQAVPARIIRTVLVAR